MAECGRHGDEGWRKDTRHPEPRRPLETQDSRSCTRMEAPKGNKQKGNERLGEGRHPDVRQTVEEKNVDGRPERAAESDPDGSDPRLRQNVGARKIGVRAVPSLRVRERRLGSSVVELQTETMRSHPGESAPEGYSALGVGKKPQERRGGRDRGRKRNEEQCGSRRSSDNDDSSKKTVGKLVEELGGYFCDGRLHAWTDGSCLDPLASDIESGEPFSRKAAR